MLGEAEDVIKDFVAAWERGERSGIFTAEKFQVDVTKTPMPRFDLLNLKDYLYVCVQYSRGCPFTCEFCDIIELYGRRAAHQDQRADAGGTRSRYMSSAIAATSTSSTTI